MCRHRILALLFVVAAAASPASAASPPPSPDCLPGEAEAATGEAIDARAVRLGDGRVVRLAGIEPFNVLPPGAEEAEAALRSRLAVLLADRSLRLRLTMREPDRYGRLPAMVWAGDDLLQEKAAREGLAIAFAPGDTLPCFDRILAAEQQARASGNGFWKGQRLPGATPSALAPRVGSLAIFEGLVLSVGNRATRSYLNFGRRWSEDVTAEIAAADRGSFGGEAPLAALAGQRVRIRGFLEEKGGPMVVLHSPMQLEVLGPRNAKRTTGAAPGAP